MKILFIFLMVFILNGCNKPKSVLICGDHVCINKAEAEQYFEENLTLEVKIVDKKSKKNIDLVELNLKSTSKDNKEIIVYNKSKTNEKIKILSNDEINKKKAEIKARKRIKKQKVKKNKITREAKLKKKEIISKKQADKLNLKKNTNDQSQKITDICTILEKCSIDEISKYLVKQGKKRKFPDITVREK